MKVKIKEAQKIIKIELDSEHLETDDGSKPVILLKHPQNLDVRFEYPQLGLRLKETLNSLGFNEEELKNQIGEQNIDSKKIKLVEIIAKHQIEVVKLLAVKFEGADANITEEEINLLAEANIIGQINEKLNAELDRLSKLEAEKKS